MAWDDGLLDQQRDAARHVGSSARLLAGPGTGKTTVLTRRVLYLAREQGIPADTIVALTFTRAASFELRSRLALALEGGTVPRVATLHAFALRQLMRNRNRLQVLPSPLRVADDWEERHIVLEELKRELNLENIREAREKLALMETDWQMLQADANPQADPGFIGAWNEHRRVYGYTLRGELIFRLKRALEQDPDFALEIAGGHLLVDEYQDLNLCDLEVIKEITNRGFELMVAGDDDQSIYGFRKAHPDGIRRFPEHYPGAVSLPLEVCMRCDPAILALAEFVANLDHRRIPKGIRPADGREGGEVRLLRFEDQTVEARAVAELVTQLITQGLQRTEILILLRSDRYGAFSSVFADALESRGIAVCLGATASTPLDEPPGRVLLSIMRLWDRGDDDLARRTLFKVRPGNNIGDGAFQALYTFCATNGLRVSEALGQLTDEPARLPTFGSRFKADSERIADALGQLPRAEEEAALDDLLEGFATAAGELGVDAEALATAVAYIGEVIASGGLETVSETLRAIETARASDEQVVDPDKVNLLTMHKAKGLDAKAVIIAAVEDEHIPGRQEDEPALGDERRLLFVSLTRAKHHLFLTYCNNRTHQQRNLGRNAGVTRRTLTRFLREAPLRPEDGVAFVDGRGHGAG